MFFSRQDPHTLYYATQFMMKTTEGKDLTIDTTPTTTWLHADGHAAKASELVAGSRVVITMNVDGKTAASVKVSAPAKK